MEKFFAAVRNMFNVPDLRRRIFFTLGLLAVYRFGAHVTAPGINIKRLEEVSGVPCAIISTGSDRSETIVRDDTVIQSWLSKQLA